jgi:hypothetical protein
MAWSNTASFGVAPQFSGTKPIQPMVSSVTGNVQIGATFLNTTTSRGVGTGRRKLQPFFRARTGS